MLHTKKVTKSGGVSIPVDLRRELELQPGDALDVVEENGTISLVRHLPRCVFCSTTEKVILKNGKGICKDCLEELGGAAVGEE